MQTLEAPHDNNLVQDSEEGTILNSPGLIALLGCVVQHWSRTKSLRLAYGYDPDNTTDPMNPANVTRKEQEKG